MKRVALFLVFSAVALGLSAQIVASKTSGCAPLTQVQFSFGQSGNWDFGDGTSATGDAVTHTYSNPGTYNVTFSIGGVQQGAQTITVYGNPTAEFVASDSSGCVPFNTSFTDQSVGGGGVAIAQWEWAFGDGVKATTQNPSHTYSSTGTFNVSLVVTDANGCDAAVTKNSLITVSNAPVAFFTTTPSPAASCTAPLTVSFNNQSRNSTGGTTGISYAWDFGDGTTSTDANPAPVNYTANGTYTVRLTVTEAGGCSRSTTRIVSVGGPQAISGIPDTVCLGRNIALENNSTGATSFTWNFSGGPTYNTKNPVHNFNTPGNQTITLTASGGGCSDDTTFVVNVEDFTVDFTRSPTFFCQEPYCVDFVGSASIPNIASWNYSFGDFTTASAKDTTHCYSVHDTTYWVHDPYHFTTTLLAISTNGCQAQISYTDTVYPVSAFFSPDSAMGCAPMVVTFSDSTRSKENIVSWEYDFGDGTGSNAQNPTHTYTNPGEYVVTLIATDAAGCKDTSFPVTILVGEPLPLNFTLSSNSVCVGDTVSFTDISGHPELDYIHFSTNSNSSADCINGSTHTYSGFDEVGMLDVTMSANYNGCIFSSTQSNALEVKGPKGALRYTGLCANPLDYQFIGEIQGADTWHWDFGDGTVLLNSSDSTPAHTYAASGDYLVKLITVNNSSGCANDTAEIEVHVRQIQAVITGDSVLCKGISYQYTGENSVDEYGNCENTYWWDQGDKTPPRLREDSVITYAFPDTGAYRIRLIVKDENGCRDTAEKVVRVSRIESGFTLDTNSGCLPLAISVTDTSYSDTVLTQWSWALEGTEYSTSQNNTLNVTSPGTQTLSLIVTDSVGCKDTATATILPLVPDTNFSATPTRLCSGSSATFTLSNPASIAAADWTFGNVLGTSNSKNPAFTFNSAGTFDVKVEVVDTNGCPGQRTRTAYISVEDYPVAGFSTSEDTNTVICYPVAIDFTDTSTGSVLVSRSWDLGIGSPIVPNPTVTWNYDAPGTYNVELIVTTQNGCKDTVERTLQIVGPIADFDMSVSKICVGEDVTFTIKDTADVWTYEWDFGDGSVGGEVSPVTHTYNDVPKGLSTFVQLIAFSDNKACEYTKSYPLDFEQVAANFGLSDTIICQNSVVQVTDSSLGASTYKWDISNGSSFSIATIPDQIFSSPGTETVRLIIQNSTLGCTDTLIKEILVNPLPTVAALDTGFCDGDVVLLKSSSPQSNLTVAWTPAAAIASPSQFNTTAVINQSTNFTVTVTDTNGCSASDQAAIQIEKQKDPIYLDTCVVIGDTLTIGNDFGAGYTYDWTGSPADLEWLTCKDCGTQDVLITEEVDEVNYTVYYKDTLGCFTNEMFLKICIVPTYAFDVPTAFTPDGDGVNDIIYLRGHGIKRVIEFKIFNRWGELVFESTSMDHGWDGIYKERDQNMEMYIYKATVEFYNGKTESKGGSITIIR